MAKLADALALGASEATHEGSSPFPGTKMELKIFEEAEMRDARSASQWFPPRFPPESAEESAKNKSEFGAQACGVFSPRRRCEPKISSAQTFLEKRSESEAILSKD